MKLSIARMPLRVPLVAAAAVLLPDLVTKEWARAHLHQGPRQLWRGHVDYLAMQNHEGAWGLLQSSGPYRTLVYAVFAAVIIATSLWLARRLRRYQWLAGVGLGVAVGAALGDTSSRIRDGTVTDCFIDVHAQWQGVDHQWPSFSLTDVAAAVGGMLFLLGLNAVPSFGVRWPLGWSFRNARLRRGLATRLVTLPLQLAIPLSSRVPVLSAVWILDATHLAGGIDRLYGTRPTLAVALAILLLAVCLALGLALVALGFLGLARVWYRGRRLSQPTLDELRSMDSRKPVLLLRAFFRDEERIAARHRVRQWIPIVTDISVYFPWTLEDALTDMLMWIGPPEALGRPGEDLPAAGAARAYVPEAGWRAKVEALAAEAQLVVVVVDDTPSVRWEIQTLLGSALRERVVLVLPPAPGSGLAKQRPTAWYEAWERLRQDTPLPPVDDRVALVRFGQTGEARTVPAKSARAWDVVDAFGRELEARDARSSARDRG